MKNFILLIIVLTFIMCPIVNATTTPNGVEIEENGNNDNTFSLYCEWNGPNGGYYINIDRASIEDTGNVEGNAAIFNEASNATLKMYYFMNEDGSLDCPNYLVTDRPTTKILGFSNHVEIPYTGTKNEYQLRKEKSKCTGKCDGSQGSQNESWSCEYSSVGSVLTIKYDGLYRAYFPDGSSAELSQNDIDPSCPDIYYNKKTHEMIRMYYDINNQVINQSHYDKLCRNDKNDYEYFCAGECDYPNNATIDCNKQSNLLRGTGDDSWCSGEFGRLLKQIFLLIKFAVPILILALSVIDFIKAIMAQNQDDIKKASNKLIRRLIIGTIIFLLPTLIDLLLYLAGIESSLCGL